MKAQIRVKRTEVRVYNTLKGYVKAMGGMLTFADYCKAVNREEGRYIKSSADRRTSYYRLNLPSKEVNEEIITLFAKYLSASTSDKYAEAIRYAMGNDWSASRFWITLRDGRAYAQYCVGQGGNREMSNLRKTILQYR